MVFMMRFFYLSGGGSGGEGGGVGLPGSLQQGLQGRAGVLVRLPENINDGVKFSILPGFFPGLYLLSLFALAKWTITRY